MQDESYGAQVFSFCEKEGYSFLRLAGRRDEDEKILQVIEQLDKAIDYINKSERFDKVMLCGGSAGGHVALLCAFKEANDNDFKVPGVTVDGVIALYPCVDPEASYDYYVNNAGLGQGIAGELGNVLYCSLLEGSSGSLAGETKKLDEEVFGKRNDNDNYYTNTAIKNCLGKRDIPVFIAQGELDSMIYVKSVDEFYNKLRSENRTAVYLKLPGTEHVFDMMNTVAWGCCEKELTGFVRKCCN